MSSCEAYFYGQLNEAGQSRLSKAGLAGYIATMIILSSPALDRETYRNVVNLLGYAGLGASLTKAIFAVVSDRN